MKIRITKIFHFEMAHVLHQYDGPCKNVHGHSYKLEVTIKGEPISDCSSPKLGMIMDFGDLKKLVNQNIVEPFDHALVIMKGYEDKILSVEACQEMKIVFTDNQPTSENLIIIFAERMNLLLPDHITLERLRLYETNSSYTEWLKSDQ